MSGDDTLTTGGGREPVLPPRTRSPDGLEPISPPPPLCGECGKTPATIADWRPTRRETLQSESHEGIDIWSCPCCGGLFAKYWWEVIDWSGGDDELRRCWVPVTAAEADELRKDHGLIHRLVVSRRHLLQESDGTFQWRDAGGFWGPAFLPPG